jgi:hypothetical protein
MINNIKKDVKCCNINNTCPIKSLNPRKTPQCILKCMLSCFLVSSMLNMWRVNVCVWRSVQYVYGSWRCLKCCEVIWSSAKFCKITSKWFHEVGEMYGNVSRALAVRWTYHRRKKINEISVWKSSSSNQKKTETELNWTAVRSFCGCGCPHSLRPSVVVALKQIFI